jgi:hypothetical protein
MRLVVTIGIKPGKSALLSSLIVYSTYNSGLPCSGNWLSGKVSLIIYYVISSYLIPIT